MENPNIETFLKELDLLSRKHGIWIEVEDTRFSAWLVDQDFNILTDNFYNDEDTQEYIAERN